MFAIVKVSITFVLVDGVAPPAYTALLELEQPPPPCLATVKLPKSIAFPKVLYSTNSITSTDPGVPPPAEIALVGEPLPALAVCDAVASPKSVALPTEAIVM